MRNVLSSANIFGRAQIYVALWAYLLDEPYIPYIVDACSNRTRLKSFIPSSEFWQYFEYMHTGIFDSNFDRFCKRFDDEFKQLR